MSGRSGRLLGLAVALGLWTAGCGAGAPARPGPPSVDIEELDGTELFGVGPEVTRKTPEGMRVRFRSRTDPGGRAALVYARSRIAQGTVVEIRLNGVAIARVPPSDPLRTAPEVLLPPVLLRGDDELAFVPASGGPWQVGELRVVFDPAPPCGPGECAAKARELFERAVLLHADRAVAADNLARAAALLREALLHVERVEPPPPLRGRIAALLAEASGELDERCRGLRFAAVGQLHLGRWSEVRATTRELAARFPAPSHPCHRTARRLRERLAELEEEP